MSYICLLPVVVIAVVFYISIPQERDIILEKTFILVGTVRVCRVGTTKAFAVLIEGCGSCLVDGLGLVCCQCFGSHIMNK